MLYYLLIKSTEYQLISSNHKCDNLSTHFDVHMCRFLPKKHQQIRIEFYSFEVLNFESKINHFFIIGTLIGTLFRGNGSNSEMTTDS